MKYIYLIFNWAFGFLFLSMGAFSLTFSVRSGLCLIVASALFLPPVRSFVYAKSNKTLSVQLRVILVFALILASSFFSTKEAMVRIDRENQEAARMKSEREIRLRQETIDYFTVNREEIISSVKKALLERNYQLVISESNRYLVSNDKELTQINIQAKNEVQAIQKAEKTKQLLDELKGVSSNEYEKNRNLYQQLLRLHPDNESYKTKLSFYGGKVEEEKQKQIAAQLISTKEETHSPAPMNWRYFHGDYEMGRGRVHRAITESTNTVNFGFPYRGHQNGTLILRTHPKYGKDVIFEIERGQLLVRNYEDSKALVRFDDSDPISYKIVGAEDHSTTSAFFRDYQGFVSKMLKSKKVRISIPVYQQGNPVFEFDVSEFSSDAYLENSQKAGK